MPLEIYAIKNYLKTGKAPFLIRSRCSSVVDEDEFLDRVSDLKGCLSRNDIKSVLDSALEALIELLVSGVYVTTNFGAFHAGVRGTLKESTDYFLPDSDTTDHEIDVYFIPNRDFRYRIRTGVTTIRVHPADKSCPEIHHIKVEGLQATTAFPGSVLTLEGMNLVFDPDDSECGLFLKGKDENPVRPTLYLHIDPHEVILKLPTDITSGNYDICYHTRPYGTGTRRQSRILSLVISENI